MYEAVNGILALAFLALFVWIIWQVFAIVWQMADNRRHNPWGWIFISVCWSPFGSMFVMWMFFPLDAVDN